jgi:hypothetical protein
VDDKPLEEKTVLHSKDNITIYLENYQGMGARGSIVVKALQAGRSRVRYLVRCFFKFT